MKNRDPHSSDHLKEVGIWIRVSTEDQAKGESPEHHEKRARYYAESKNWTIKETYHLEAVSGKSVMPHPECQRMLKDIKTGHIAGLIFSKLARLARNTRELLDFADIFRAHDADLISLEESIDTSTPAGRFFYTMISGMAQWEREEIAGRVAASVPIRAKLGKPLGGGGSYGYRWKDRQLIPDPQEAPVRKLIYELFMEHRRRKTVATVLNQQGYRTRKGGKFGFTTIERLLRDPTAKGVRRANYTRTLDGGKNWTLKPESEWVIFQVEPIVSEELWNRCNAILDEQKLSQKPPTKYPKELFAGIVFCACGSKMYVKWRTIKYICVSCYRKIPKEDLEAIFQEQLKSFVFSPVEIAQYMEQANGLIKEKQELLNVLLVEQKKLERDMEKVYDLYLSEHLSKDGFAAKYRPLEERLKELQNQIPELQATIDFAKIRALSSDEVLHEAKDLYTRWPELDHVEKRKVVENITQKIVVGDGTIEITLCYLPTSSEIMANDHRRAMALERLYFLA